MDETTNAATLETMIQDSLDQLNEESDSQPTRVCARPTLALGTQPEINGYASQNPPVYHYQSPMACGYARCRKAIRPGEAIEFQRNEDGMSITAKYHPSCGRTVISQTDKVDLPTIKRCVLTYSVTSSN